MHTQMAAAPTSSGAALPNFSTGGLWLWDLFALLDALALPWGVKQLAMAQMTCSLLGVTPPPAYFALNWSIAGGSQAGAI